MIRIALSEQKVKNGERVKGSVTFEGSKAPRKIEVICRWRIEGKGRSHEEVVDRSESEAMTIPFDFAIPREGPLSYDGQLLRIIWEIAADADIAMAFDEHEAVAFTVVPRKWDPAEWAEPEDDDVGQDDEMTE
jgi:hypothetical protein